MALRSFLTFCLALASTFVAIGVLNDLFDLEPSDAPHLDLKVLTTSGFAVLWKLVLHKPKRKLPVLVAIAQVAWIIAAARLFPAPHNDFYLRAMAHSRHPAWPAHPGIDPLPLRFGRFFQIEDKRYFAAHTVIELASRIQQQPVPPIQSTVGTIEASGISMPCGRVGGDLHDLIQADDLICAYVADVAGHGVAAGAMMSVVKTAVRMHFITPPQPVKSCLRPPTIPNRRCKLPIR
jgi:hypothetical protein